MRFLTIALLLLAIPFLAAECEPPCEGGPPCPCNYSVVSQVSYDGQTLVPFEPEPFDLCILNSSTDAAGHRVPIEFNAHEYTVNPGQFNLPDPFVGVIDVYIPADGEWHCEPAFDIIALQNYTSDTVGTSGLKYSPAFDTYCEMVEITLPPTAVQVSAIP